MNIPGIHHITAIAENSQQNLDFYTQALGLRLVKLTVNFDVPDTYHFYFGDEIGHPGTILTFFLWPGTRRGKPGTGQATRIAFSIPPESAGYWTERLNQFGVTIDGTSQRFDEEIISFLDPDGVQLELVAGEEMNQASPWLEGPVPPESAIQSFHGVTLMEEGFESTAELLTGTFGFQLVAEAEKRARFKAPSDQPGRFIDLVSLPSAPAGITGTGTVHHIAWRTESDERQSAWREQLVSLGYDVTPVLDRQYFHSIYFREPGGVLFEIATDPPGFTTDESADCLGSSMKLPPWLEPRRLQIERELPALRLPNVCSELV